MKLVVQNSKLCKGWTNILKFRVLAGRTNHLRSGLCLLMFFGVSWVGLDWGVSFQTARSTPF